MGFSTDGHHAALGRQEADYTAEEAVQVAAGPSTLRMLVHDYIARGAEINRLREAGDVKAINLARLQRRTIATWHELNEQCEEIADLRQEWDSCCSREASTFAELKERRTQVAALVAVLSKREPRRVSDSLRATAASTSHPAHSVGLRAETLTDWADQLDAYTARVEAAISPPDAITPAPPVLPAHVRTSRSGLVIGSSVAHPHGGTCDKVPHDNPAGVYRHRPDDDGPYAVDGLMYCGRCHGWIR